MKTRGKNTTKTAAEATAATASTAPKFELEPESKNPPKVFVLPKGTCPAARIISIKNPRHSGQSRYLCCPEKGFYEFKKIGPPKSTPGSWLLAPSKKSNESTKKHDSTQSKAGDYKGSKGYVTSSADMFIATPVDALFLILPFLAPPSSTKNSESSRQLFLARDDYLDNLVAESPHLRSFMRNPHIQSLFEARMAAVCDSVDAGVETMYRLNPVKLLEELLQKAQRTAEHGLPASLEEKLVRRALEVPLLSIKRQDSSFNTENEEVETVSSGVTPATETTDSQTALSSFTSSSPSTTPKPTAQPPPPETETETEVIPSTISAPAGIPELLRIRTALDYITSNYLAPPLESQVKSLLTTPHSSSTNNKIPDFAPLIAHLTHLSSLRSQVYASRSIGDGSRKRFLMDEKNEAYDVETGESRAEKRRKKEEEEKRRKAGESKGVRDLKKVDVKGMKKMSDFFKKVGG